MNASLKYERLEIIENKCRYSFEKENNKFENIEKLDCSLSLDFLINTEQNEINFFKERIQKLDIKEQILLNSLNDIKSEITNEKPQIIKFNTDIDKKSDNNNDNISNSIFNSISRMVHKILHKRKMINGKEVKECTIHDNLNKQLELEDNIEVLIKNLKEENKFFEFIAIKSIMISIANLMTELINSYLAKNEKLMMISENKGDRNFDFDFGKEELNIIEANIFEDIYNDFVTQSNLCSSELEEFFIISLDCFRKKYQMNFTLSELFTDIFWNSIFHNKELCTLYINSYLNNEIYGDIKNSLKNIAKIILKVNIPLKHQIVELLGLHQLEEGEKTDLMTLIESQKKKYHWEITKSEKEKEKLNKINLIKKDEEVNLNTNSNDSNNEDKNNEKKNNNIVNIDNIKFNVIKANDISAFKKEKQKQALNESKTSNINYNDNNKENFKEKQKENKEKEDIHKNDLKKKNNDNDNIMDFEHKTVDEIYNYINGDKIVKNKRKKKSRKNKKAKKEENIVEENQEEIVDSIVLQFKQDLSDKLIHARYITKIKPILSEEWIKIISSYN